MAGGDETASHRDEPMFFAESRRAKADSGNVTDMADELESAKMYIDLLQKQLKKAQETARNADQAVIRNLEVERDRYRSARCYGNFLKFVNAHTPSQTVLSLAYQNKLLQADLSKTRKACLACHATR